MGTRTGVPLVQTISDIYFDLYLPSSPKPLAARVPSLINYPGVIGLDQVPTVGPYFHENLPLRKGFPLDLLLEDGTGSTIESPLVNTVHGAMKIQEVLDWRQWVMQSANSVAYAVHLRKSPLSGVPAKRIIIQAGKGDQTLPNPGLAAIARAGDLADRITIYRNDLAFAEDAGVPKDPHTFAFRLDSSDPLVASISGGVQDQMAVFFASDGERVIQPQPFRFFETPIVGPYQRVWALFRKHFALEKKASQTQVITPDREFAH